MEPKFTLRNFLPDKLELHTHTHQSHDRGLMTYIVLESGTDLGDMDHPELLLKNLIDDHLVLKLPDQL